jgi:hypothetical protein
MVRIQSKKCRKIWRILFENPIICHLLATRSDAMTKTEESEREMQQYRSTRALAIVFSIM